MTKGLQARNRGTTSHKSMENIPESSILAFLQIDNSVETYNKPITRYNKPETEYNKPKKVQQARKRYNKSEIRVQQATNRYPIL